MKHFKCPDCGGTSLEETQDTTVIDGDPSDFINGTIFLFSCIDCDFKLFCGTRKGLLEYFNE